MNVGSHSNLKGSNFWISYSQLPYKITVQKLIKLGWARQARTKLANVRFELLKITEVMAKFEEQKNLRRNREWQFQI